MSSGKYPFYRSSQLVNTYCEYADYDGCKLIFGTGGSASVHYADIPFSTSADCIVAKAKDDSEVYLPYIFYYFRGNIHVLEEGFRGAGLRHISKEYIRRIKIPLPTFEKQRRIAAILDKADEVRSKRQEAIRLTEKLLRSAFLDMFGDPVTNPKGWPRERIGNLANIITGSTPPSKKSGMFGGEIPFVTPGDLESGRSASRYVTKEGAKNSRMARKGATLVCCIGATIGKTDMALSQVAFNQQINAVEWDKEIVDEYGFLCLSYGRISVINAAIKTTLPIIKKSLFSDIRIPVPPLDEQRKFAKFFQKRGQYYTRLFSMQKETENLFNTLVQRAFKGEL